MAKMKKSNRSRPRPGAVMAEMEPETRAMLEAIKDERAKETGESTSLSSTIRHLIRTDFVRRKLKLEAERK